MCCETIQKVCEISLLPRMLNLLNSDEFNRTFYMYPLNFRNMLINLFMLHTNRKAEGVGVDTLVSTPIYNSLIILRLQFDRICKNKTNMLFINIFASFNNCNCIFLARMCCFMDSWCYILLKVCLLLSLPFCDKSNFIRIIWIRMYFYLCSTYVTTEPHFVVTMV